MNRQSLTRRLKLILLGIALCGLLCYIVLIPHLVRPCFSADTTAFGIYLGYLCLSGIPCYLVLYHAHRIVRNIGLDRAFTEENAVCLRKISTLAALDAAYIFLGHLLLLPLGWGNGMLLLLALVIVFVGVSVSVAAAALSHLVLRAAELQEQSDLTI